MAGISDLTAGKIYIGPEIPANLDQSYLTLDDDANPFSGTLSCVGPEFFGAPTNVGFARACVNIGPALPPFAPGIPGLALDVTGITHHNGSMNNFGMSNMFGTSNTLGILNKLGLSNIFGLSSRFGYGTKVGGQTAAEPNIDYTAPLISFDSPVGELWGFWRYNVFEISTEPDAVSDIRLKKNIRSIENPLDKVLKLNPVTFEWNNKIPDSIQHKPVEIGFIAQEVKEIIPEVISIRKLEDNETKEMLEDIHKIDYAQLTAVLAGAIQEQQKQIEDLKSTVKDLTEKLNGAKLVSE